MRQNPTPNTSSSLFSLAGATSPAAGATVAGAGPTSIGANTGTATSTISGGGHGGGGGGGGGGPGGAGYLASAAASASPSERLNWRAQPPSMTSSSSPSLLSPPAAMAAQSALRYDAVRSTTSALTPTLLGSVSSSSSPSPPSQSHAGPSPQTVTLLNRWHQQQQVQLQQQQVQQQQQRQHVAMRSLHDVAAMSIGVAPPSQQPPPPTTAIGQPRTLLNTFAAWPARRAEPVARAPLLPPPPPPPPQPLGALPPPSSTFTFSLMGAPVAPMSATSGAAPQPPPPSAPPALSTTHAADAGLAVATTASSPASQPPSLSSHSWTSLLQHGAPPLPSPSAPRTAFCAPPQVELEPPSAPTAAAAVAAAAAIASTMAVVPPLAAAPPPPSSTASFFASWRSSPIATEEPAVTHRTPSIPSGITHTPFTLDDVVDEDRGSGVDGERGSAVHLGGGLGDGGTRGVSGGGDAPTFGPTPAPLLMPAPHGLGASPAPPPHPLQLMQQSQRPQASIASAPPPGFPFRATSSSSSSPAAVALAAEAVEPAVAERAGSSINMETEAVTPVGGISFVDQLVADEEELIEMQRETARSSSSSSSSSLSSFARTSSSASVSASASGGQVDATDDTVLLPSRDESPVHLSFMQRAPLSRADAFDAARQLFAPTSAAAAAAAAQPQLEPPTMPPPTLHDPRYAFTPSSSLLSSSSMVPPGPIEPPSSSMFSHMLHHAAGAGAGAGVARAMGSPPGLPQSSPPQPAVVTMVGGFSSFSFDGGFGGGRVDDAHHRVATSTMTDGAITPVPVAPSTVTTATTIVPPESMSRTPYAVGEASSGESATAERGGAVHIVWDLSTVPFPNELAPMLVIQRVVQLAGREGVVSSFRCIVHPGALSDDIKLDMQACGVEVEETTSRRQVNSTLGVFVVSRLLRLVLSLQATPQSSWQSAARPSLLLISADRDLSMALSTIRRSGLFAQVILVYESSAPSGLIHSASGSVAWRMLMHGLSSPTSSDDASSPTTTAGTSSAGGGGIVGSPVSTSSPVAEFDVAGKRAVEYGIGALDSHATSSSATAAASRRTTAPPPSAASATTATASLAASRRSVGSGDAGERRFAGQARPVPVDEPVWSGSSRWPSSSHGSEQRKGTSAAAAAISAAAASLTAAAIASGAGSAQSAALTSRPRSCSAEDARALGLPGHLTPVHQQQHYAEHARPYASVVGTPASSTDGSSAASAAISAPSSAASCAIGMGPSPRPSPRTLPRAGAPHAHHHMMGSLLSLGPSATSSTHTTPTSATSSTATTAQGTPTTTTVAELAVVDERAIAARHRAISSALQAVLSYCEKEKIIPRESVLKKRLLDSKYGAEMDFEIFFQNVIDTGLAVSEGDAPQRILWPTTANGEARKFACADFFSPRTRLSADQTDELIAFLKKHKPEVDRGRFGFAQYLSRYGPPFIQALPHGVLVELVQLLLNQKVLQFRKGKVSTSSMIDSNPLISSAIVSGISSQADVSSAPSASSSSSSASEGGGAEDEDEPTPVSSSSAWGRGARFDGASKPSSAALLGRRLSTGGGGGGGALDPSAQQHHHHHHHRESSGGSGSGSGSSWWGTSSAQASPSIGGITYRSVLSVPPSSAASNVLPSSLASSTVATSSSSISGSGSSASHYRRVTGGGGARSRSKPDIFSTTTEQEWPSLSHASPSWSSSSSSAASSAGAPASSAGTPRSGPMRTGPPTSSSSSSSSSTANIDRILDSLSLDSSLMRQPNVTAPTNRAFIPAAVLPLDADFDAVALLDEKCTLSKLSTAQAVPPVPALIEQASAHASATSATSPPPQQLAWAPLMHATGLPLLRYPNRLPVYHYERTFTPATTADNNMWVCVSTLDLRMHGQTNLSCLKRFKSTQRSKCEEARQEAATRTLEATLWDLVYCTCLVEFRRTRAKLSRTHPRLLPAELDLRAIDESERQCDATSWQLELSEQDTVAELDRLLAYLQQQPVVYRMESTVIQNTRGARTVWKCTATVQLVPTGTNSGGGSGEEAASNSHVFPPHGRADMRVLRAYDGLYVPCAAQPVTCSASQARKTDAKAEVAGQVLQLLERPQFAHALHAAVQARGKASSGSGGRASAGGSSSSSSSTSLLERPRASEPAEHSDRLVLHQQMQQRARQQQQQQQQQPWSGGLLGNWTPFLAAPSSSGHEPARRADAPPLIEPSIPRSLGATTATSTLASHQHQEHQLQQRQHEQQRQQPQQQQPMSSALARLWSVGSPHDHDGDDDDDDDADGSSSGGSGDRSLTDPGDGHSAGDGARSTST